MNKQSQSGFSLIEIMIAIAVMAVMAAVTVPFITGYLQKGKFRATQASLRAIHTSVESFYGDTNQYPETLKDLVRRPTNEEIANKWPAPYLKDEKALVDSFGNKFQYQVTPDQEHPYELYSYGAKGKSATKAERISVWNL